MASMVLRRRTSYFNPRSPDGERRITSNLNVRSRRFQSTLPGWGATEHRNMVDRTVEFQSTLPGWGATPPDKTMFMAEQFQSTLPGWGATLNRIRLRQFHQFQSTLPGWGATRRQSHFITEDIISIHAPRMGSDVSDAERKGLEQYFNPRSPDGERRCAGQNGSPPRLDFNPRSPDGERHSLGRLGFGVDYFNPRSPDGERPCASRSAASMRNFNPRSPDGERLQSGRYRGGDVGISIHAPRMGSDATGADTF